jgi:hypothetical protein
MSATKKANQSSPRLLDREGTSAGPSALCAFQSGNRYLPPALLVDVTWAKVAAIVAF